MNDVPTSYALARREVSWFFDGAARALGLRGVGYDGGGGVVWDDRRCERLHESQLSVTHRMHVDRFERIQRTMMRLPANMANDLKCVYVPFGSARASWQLQSAFTDEGRQMLALALECPELRTIYARSLDEKRDRAFACLECRAADAEVLGAGGGCRDPVAHGWRVAPTFLALMQFAEDEVSRMRVRPGRALPRGHKLEPVLQAARKRELEAIGLYEAYRRHREKTRERENQDRLANLERALHRKLWGT